MSDTLLGLNTARWEKVVEATHGAALACFQCGACTAICPWGLVRHEPLNLRKIMRAAQVGMSDTTEDLWLCTTCAACQALCPRGVQVADVIEPLRKLAWEARAVPAGLSAVMWDLHWDGNPFGRPPSRRSDWARGLDIHHFEPTHEVLYYVGCSASYDPRMRKVARAIAETLQTSGVCFGTLGDDEPCCGDPARSLGQLDYLELLVERTTRQFREARVTRIVTTSPHCFDMFRHHYPGLTENVEVLHYTQYLDRLRVEGRLRLERPVERTVTFHDPCYLGRHNNEYDAPRALLAAIPGLRLVEMAENRAEALCCGGGGGRMWMDTPAGERFADLRTRQAEAIGAEALVTACPHCITCLEDSARASGLRVLDVAELIRQAVA
jgi:Fe-S oxidoreductase